MKLERLKKILSTIVMCGMFIPTLLMSSTALAAEPRFNFLPGDWELMRGTNKSQNSDTWSDPVNGVAGDTFAGIIYYHNGIKESVARNTRIKLNLPSATTNKTVKATATVSADNAPTISDTIVDGKVSGLSGLTVNLNEDANISFVPGSVKWFPNFKDGSTEQPLPYGQTGEELLSSNGLKIGDINGCWDFIGYVTFRFKAEKNEFPALSIEKLVRNVTDGQATFVKENAANPADVLEYKINFANNGNAPADNVFLADVLPANTRYISGTTIISNGTGETVIGDGIVGNGISLNTLNPKVAGYVKFKVEISAGVANNQILINTAHLIYNKDDLSDIAKTKVVYGSNPGQPGGGGLPVTGDETIYISILAGIAAIFAYVYVQKRKALAVKYLK